MTSLTFFRKLLPVFSLLLVLLFLTGSLAEEPLSEPGLTTDMIETDAHQAITWSREEGRYKEYYSEIFGWQSIETGGVVIVETDSGGLAAIVPVGMCQVASVNFEPSVTPGARVSKGDPLGFFLFGGSDIVMLFSEDLHFEMTAVPDEHILMGTSYGRIRQ